MVVLRRSRVLSNTLAGWKMGPRIEDVLVFPIKNGGKDRLPTTIFQGLTVKLRRCTFWKEDLLKSYQVIEVFDNLTYESEMFLLSHLQLSKRLLQNNMAFAAVRCLNNNLKAKKHIISITQHFTIVHPTFPSITSKVWQESIANFFFHIKSPKTPRNIRNPLLYPQKKSSPFSPKTSLLFFGNLPTKSLPFVHLPGRRWNRFLVEISRIGSNGAGLCLFDVLGNLDFQKEMPWVV